MKQSIFIVFLLTYLNAVGQVSFGEPLKINDDWKFILKDDPNFKNVNLNTANWKSVDVPYDWSVQGQLDATLASCTGYLPGGIGWFRKTIDIPEDMKDKKVFLYFEGVYNRSEVFINGKSIGSRPNGYISFNLDATPFVKFGEKNTIAVRIDHSQSADSRWYTGSGIYRNVWLIYSNPIHIKQWGVYAYPEVNQNEGILNVEVSVNNETDKSAKLDISNVLLNSEGEIVASQLNTIEVVSKNTNKIAFKLKIKDPDLWNLDHPNLYKLQTIVFQNGKEIDHTSTTTGFRTFTFDPDHGFALNGQWMKMKGVCLHHDLGILGSAFYPEVWKKRLKTLKKVGVNAIRTSHNPRSPEFYDLCDELGLLVLDEAYDEWEYPKRKWLEGWNIGTPGYEGSYDIFADWSDKDLEDMVRRDRNHLSIFAWSIGNEVDYPNDPYSHPVLDGGGDTGFTQAKYGGYKKDAPKAERLGAIAKRLVADVKKYDTSRPTTAGLAGVAMSNETDYPYALDITGYNYTENKYDSDHKKYPNRIIYGSETRNDYSAWMAVKSREHIFGQFLWTGIDYLGESGAWPSRGFYSGLLDFKGDIKPRGYFRQSLWSEKPMIYIGTYFPNNEPLSLDAWPFWNYKKDQTIRVVCYTNAAKAQLELNGKVVGKLKDYDEKTGIISWDIPFEFGVLEAVGYDMNGKEISRYAVKSSKEPKTLKSYKVSKNISKDDGVEQIMVDVLDTDGTLVKFSENMVTCTISGPAELLGLEAGNNEDMSDYTDNKQAVFHGKILAYIKATGETGTVSVKFNSPGLQGTEVKFKIK